MKNLLNELKIAEPEKEFLPNGQNPTIDDIQKAEKYFRMNVEKMFEEHFYRIALLNGGKIELNEIAELKEQAVCNYLVGWINKHFEANLNPILCSFALNAAKYHN